MLYASIWVLGWIAVWYIGQEKYSYEQAIKRDSCFKQYSREIYDWASFCMLGIMWPLQAVAMAVKWVKQQKAGV
jgi:hypothetical protein